MTSSKNVSPESVNVATMITLPDGSTMDTATAAAIIAKAQKADAHKKAYVAEYCARPEVQVKRAAYRADYFKRDSVKLAMKNRRDAAKGMVDTALNAECIRFASNNAVMKLHAQWIDATGVKKGQLRTKLVAMIDALNG